MKRILIRRLRSEKKETTSATGGADCHYDGEKTRIKRIKDWELSKKTNG